MYGIKARRTSMGRYEFLTPRGGLTHLRVHAAQFTQEDAEKAIIKLRKDNPLVEFRIQKLFK